jgi:hypothetical protein
VHGLSKLNFADLLNAVEQCTDHCNIKELIPTATAHLLTHRRNDPLQQSPIDHLHAGSRWRKRRARLRNSGARFKCCDPAAR